MESESSSSATKQQVHLKKVTDIKKGKLRKLANKNREMFDEIMKEKAKTAQFMKKTRRKRRKNIELLESSVKVNGLLNGLTLRSGASVSPPAIKRLKRRCRSEVIQQEEQISEEQIKSRKVTTRLSLPQSSSHKDVNDIICVQRTTRMHGSQDNYVLLSKDHYNFWKITLSNEWKKNALSVKVGS